MPRFGWLRFRYSLRTILVVTAVTAAYFAFAAHQDAERRELISEIENSGGSVKFDESLSFTIFHSERVTEVSLPHSIVGQINCVRLKKFNNLSTLGIHNFELKGENVRMNCAGLRITKITDELLDNLDIKSLAN